MLLILFPEYTTENNLAQLRHLRVLGPPPELLRGPWFMPHFCCRDGEEECTVPPSSSFLICPPRPLEATSRQGGGGRWRPHAEPAYAAGDHCMSSRPPCRINRGSTAGTPSIFCRGGRNSQKHAAYILSIFLSFSFFFPVSGGRGLREKRQRT